MKKRFTIVFFFMLAIFIAWLMHHSLSSSSSGLLVGGKYWSDFGAQLPLIRSFSLGNNWPPEHPLYPGSPIRYHFLFYALVGLLEKTGLPLVTALNFPSFFGLFSLAILVWLVSYRLFKSYFVSFLSTLFIFFNASLSWVEFLKIHSIPDLWKLAEFPAFGPWNGSLIAAFWNLNIFTNQRHLALSFAVVFLLIYTLQTSHRYLLYFTGFFIGILLLLNQPAAVLASLFVISFFIFKSHIRLPILISLIGFVPWLLVYSSSIASPSLPFQAFGFLMPKPITLLSFINYWFVNFGLHLILIPLGLVFSYPKSKVFILPLVAMFILPNIWQFSPDMINNHKFFNFFLITGGIFSAYALFRLKYLALVIVPFMILGGLVDFFPIKNDTYYTLSDYRQSADVGFFLTSTPKNSVILNSTWFYHPASLAGRKIFNGYSYFTWSYGYDQVGRENITKDIYSSTSKSIACAQLINQNIDYVELSPTPESFLLPNREVWSQFTPIYHNPSSGLSVYNVATNCHAN